MSFRRVGRLAAIGILTLVCLSCGEVYRPVVIPLSTTPPTPAGFHTVFSISANVPTYPGGVLPGGVDVLSFFTPAFQSTVATGMGAVTTISLPTGSQPVFVNTTQSNVVYVANYNSNSVSAISLSTNSITNSAPVGVHPVALAETPNGLKLYVANQGGNSVSSLNAADLSPNSVNNADGSAFTGINPSWVVARHDSQKV